MPPKRRPGSLSNKQPLKSVFDETLNKTTKDSNIKELIRYLNKKFLDETKNESQSTARSRASRETGTNKQAFSVQQLYSVVTHLKKQGISDEAIRNISIEKFVETHVGILMSKARTNKKYRNKTKNKKTRTNKKTKRNKKTRRNKKKRRNKKTKKN